MMKGHQISEQYAKICADSCDKVGMPWEYIEWFHGTTKEVATKSWAAVTSNVKNYQTFKPQNAKAQCATSGHAMAWCKVRDHNEPAIIFEHDAILLHNIDIDIPDNLIVALGYKIQKPEQYNHEAAGPPTCITETTNNGHEGAHAYAITPNTAVSLLKELETNGIPGAIDNTHFLKTRKTKVPIKIMSPTPAIGWLRESTIWKSSANKNYPFIDSFKNHFTE